MIEHLYPQVDGKPGPCVRCGVHYGPDNGYCELPTNLEPGVFYPAPYAPKFPFEIIKRGEDHFVAFDVETITERARRQMVALEEEAILEAVVAWLRAHGYTVEKTEASHD